MKDSEKVVGLQEMSLQEMEETNGGVWFTMAALCAGSTYLYGCALVGAFNRGYDAAKSR